MMYEPGPRAKAEHLAFTRRNGPVVLAIEPPPAKAEAQPPEIEPEPTGMEKELIDRGVSRGVAAKLIRDFPEERVRRQIEAVDWLRETKPKRIADVGAYLVDAIRQDYAAPAGFESKSQRAARETAQRAALKQEAEARQACFKVHARETEDRIKASWESLTPERRAALDAKALAGADPETRAAYEKASAPARRLLLLGLRDAFIRRRLGLPVSG